MHKKIPLTFCCQTLRNIVYAFPCIKANINTDLSVRAELFEEHKEVHRQLEGKLFSLKCLLDVKGHRGDHVWSKDPSKKGITMWIMRWGHNMGAKSLRCTSLCVMTYHQHFIFKSMFDGFPYRKQTCAVLEKMYITASEIYFVCCSHSTCTLGNKVLRLQEHTIIHHDS